MLLRLSKAIIPTALRSITIFPIKRYSAFQNIKYFHTTTMTALNRLSNINSVLSPPKTCSAVAPEDIPVRPFRTTVVGSGNWGCTIAKVVAENCIERPQEFDQKVKMWVFEEKVNGQKLTEIINTKHENVKYLPGIMLPANIVAVPDVVDAYKDSDLIIFNIPHQFLGNILRQLKGKVNKNARAISCLKGLNVSRDGCDILPDVISKELGITCGALSGANLAPEVAECKWSETTVAYTLPDDYRGRGKDINKAVLKHLFHRPYFHVHVIDDVSGISLAGALKNVVAMAAGFVDGLGWGNNAKSAVMRLGLREMIHFAKLYFPTCEERTFTEESAGVADLITTCFGGRNVRVGRYMAQHKVSAHEAEKQLLNGQSCQGIYTTKEVFEFLSKRNAIDDFPLFHVTYDIIYNDFPMEKLPERVERSDEKY